LVSIGHSAAVAFNLQQHLFGESRWALGGSNTTGNGQPKPNHDGVSKMEWLARREEPMISNKQRSKRVEKFIRCQKKTTGRAVVSPATAVIVDMP
jgi:hypothetical protein